MMIFGQTKLDKLNTILLATGLLICILLIFRYFFLGVISLIIFVIVLRMWVRCLLEELVISFLKKREGQCTDDELIGVYSKKILFVVSRLEKKEIVTIRGKDIVLWDLNRICTFDS